MREYWPGRCGPGPWCGGGSRAGRSTWPAGGGVGSSGKASSRALATRASNAPAAWKIAGPSFPSPQSSSSMPTSRSATGANTASAAAPVVAGHQHRQLGQVEVLLADLVHHGVRRGEWPAAAGAAKGPATSRPAPGRVDPGGQRQEPGQRDGRRRPDRRDVAELRRAARPIRAAAPAPPRGRTAPGPGRDRRQEGLDHRVVVLGRQSAGRRQVLRRHPEADDSRRAGGRLCSSIRPISRRASAGLVAAIRSAIPPRIVSSWIRLTAGRPGASSRRAGQPLPGPAPDRRADLGEGCWPGRSRCSCREPGPSGRGPSPGSHRPGRAIGRRPGRAGSPPGRAPRSAGPAARRVREARGETRARPSPPGDRTGSRRRSTPRPADRSRRAISRAFRGLSSNLAIARAASRSGSAASDLVLDHLDDPVGVDQGRDLGDLHRSADSWTCSGGLLGLGDQVRGRSRAPRREGPARRPIGAGPRGARRGGGGRSRPTGRPGRPAGQGSDSPSFETNRNAGASGTPGTRNRPSASVVPRVFLGPSPDWNTSAPATGLPAESTTRPATARVPTDRREPQVGDRRRRARRPSSIPRARSRAPATATRYSLLDRELGGRLVSAIAAGADLLGPVECEFAPRVERAGRAGGS